MSAKADRVIGLGRVRQPSVSRIMLKLRFALVLLLSTGNGVSADAPVGNVGPYHPQSSIDTQNPAENPGLIQQSPQQPINVQYPQQIPPRNNYNSEDYDGEQYEDNRLRLMLYPKKLITLNQTNIRTWKVNPVTNSNWNPPAVTESNEPVRRSAFDHNEKFEFEGTKDSAKNETNSTRRNETHLFVGINTSIPKDFQGKLLVNNTHISSDSLVNVSSVTGQAVGQGTNLAAATLTVPKGGVSNYSAKIVPTDKDPVIFVSQNGNVSRIEFNHQINQTVINGSEVAKGDERPPANETTKIVKMESKGPAMDNATDITYVEIENDGDYPDEEAGSDSADDVPDVPVGNPYVIVLPGMKGTKPFVGKNMSSAQSAEIITDNLMYILSNFTTSNTMNERKILRELQNQKMQLDEVSTKLDDIYQILKISKRGN